MTNNGFDIKSLESTKSVSADGVVLYESAFVRAGQSVPLS